MHWPQSGVIKLGLPLCRPEGLIHLTTYIATCDADVAQGGVIQSLQLAARASPLTPFRDPDLELIPTRGRCMSGPEHGRCDGAHVTDFLPGNSVDAGS